MKNRYFLRRAGNASQVSNDWEEVDEWTFDHSSSIIVSPDDPTLRYQTGAWIVTDGNEVKIGGTLTTQMLGQICRMLGVTIPTGSGQGWLTEPSLVFAKNLRGNLILHQMYGSNFVPQKKSAAA